MADVRSNGPKLAMIFIWIWNNVADVQYADFGGLTQPGRNFMAGCEVEIE